MTNPESNPKYWIPMAVIAAVFLIIVVMDVMR